MSYRIALSAFRLPVSIGCEEVERATLQTVRFDLEITLADEPRGGRTDRLQDTVDYQALSEVIRAVATREPYKLVERLAAVTRDELRSLMPPAAQFTLRVTKEQPPVPGLEGGVTVTISG